MKASNVARIIIITLFVLFIGLYFTQSTDYYNFEKRRITELTEAQIKEYEAAIKRGEQIDVNTYFKKNAKDYNNKISKAGLVISEKIETLFDKGLKAIFTSIENVMDE